MARARARPGALIEVQSPSEGITLARPIKISRLGHPPTSDIDTGECGPTLHFFVALGVFQTGSNRAQNTAICSGVFCFFSDL